MKEKIYDLYDEYTPLKATVILILAVILILGIDFGLWCLQAWLVMVLWNWIAVSLFNAPVLSFWLAFGLTWLVHLLFKGKSTSRKEK